MKVEYPERDSRPRGRVAGAMRIVAAAGLVAIVAGACTSAESGRPVSPTTTITAQSEASAATTRPARGPSTATTAASPRRSVAARSNPTVSVSLHAAAGDVPPGRIDPLEAPAWKASGSGWAPGDVDVSVRRSKGDGALLEMRARADASGRWDVTFVLPSDALSGSYVVVASQGRLVEEASFVLQSAAGSNAG